jgi:alkylhydroperoxidase family enzyme
MTFVETVPEGDAAGDVAQMYETDRAAYGHVPNFTKAFSHRPGVFAAWRALSGEIKAGMDLRRYELATVAAARRLRSTYCALAHGSVLVDKFVEPDELTAIVSDHHAAGLDDVDVAVMDLADKVARTPPR